MRRGAPRGPLLTDHLQGLRDIDLELELLKRKRQLMEQQQQLLNEEQYSRQRNDYEQPGYSQFNKSIHDDYSTLYEDYSRGSNNSRKRQVIPVWEDDVPAKRFYSPKRGNTSKFFGSRLGTEPNPRFPSPGQRSQSNQQGYQPAWNQSAPGSSRGRMKRPVPLMSVKTTSSAPRPVKEFKPKRVTKPTSQPNVAIDTLKKIPVAERKKMVAATVSLVTKVPVPPKDVLRAGEDPTPQVIGRLELALGKIMKDVKEEYEPRYFDLFTQTRFLRVMKQKIRERIRAMMLGKVVGSAIEIESAYREKYPKDTDKEIVDVALEMKAGDKLLLTPVPTDDTYSYFTINMQRLLDFKLNEMFTKLEEVYRTEYSKPDDGVTSDNANDFTEDVLIDEMKNKSNEGEPLPEHKHILKMMAQNIPVLLNKYISHIIKLMKLDSSYEATVNAIEAETRKQLSEQHTNTLNDKAAASQETTDQISNPEENTAYTKKPRRSLPYNLPYYVKVVGRPFLPKKNCMQNFLSQYNPKSIKKHKNVNNLLFVGFEKKDDFDNILAATGTSIGRFKLDIKVSEKTDKSNAPNEDAQIDAEIKTEDLNVDDKLLTPELDNQITDLLSAIRKADEDEKLKRGSMEINKPTEEINTDDVAGVGIKTEVNETDSLEVETPQIKTDNSEANNQNDDLTADKTPEDNTTVSVKCEETSQNEEKKDVSGAEKVGHNVSEINKTEVIETETANANNDQMDSQNSASHCSNEKTAATADETNETDPEKITEQKDSQKTSPVESPAEIKADETNKTEPEELKEEKETPILDAKEEKKLVTIPETTEDESKKDKALKTGVKESGRATPTRFSSRLATATPSTIKTRRASKLAQDNS